MLHPHLTRETDLRERFLREGYAANAVGHPGAVSVLDDDADDDGTVYLVMELLEGESLDQRWQRMNKKLSVDDVLMTADAVLDTLAAAHENGIVHRDLKPDNVFRMTTGEIKILDFGIARLRDLPGGASATRMGSLLGTPGFMAPEQARGRNDEVDARSDLWAVGATMFTLLAGRAVHEAATMNELLLAAMTAKAPPLASLAPDVPEAVAALIDRALSFEREDRFQDARSMQVAVRAALAAIGGATPSPIVSRARKSHAPLPLTRERARPSRTSVMSEEAEMLTSRPRSAPTLDAATSRRSRTGLIIVVGIAALGGGAAIPFAMQRMRSAAEPQATATAPVRATASVTAPVSASVSVTAPVSASVSVTVSASAPASVSAPASASPTVRPVAIVPRRPVEPTPPRVEPHPVPQTGRELEFTVPAPKD